MRIRLIRSLLLLLPAALLSLSLGGCPPINPGNQPLVFDRIVIDTPPTVPFTDAAVLSAVSDGALLVVRAGKTTVTLIDRARASLAHSTLLGVVLNDVGFTPIDRYYYQYDDYNPRRYAERDAAQ